MDPTGGLATVFSAFGAALTYLNSLAGESWTRYFILLAGLFVDNQIGNFTGIYAMEGVIGWVISNVFGVSDFAFPVYYGLSSLMLIFVIAPIVLVIFKAALIDRD